MTKKEEAFQVAINQQSKMDIVYVNQEAIRKKRRIWPLEFHNTQGKWRCLAWCEEAQALRTFKMASVISYKVTDRKFNKDDIEIQITKPDSKSESNDWQSYRKKQEVLDEVSSPGIGRENNDA